jgi:hypothetical protein
MSNSRDRRLAALEAKSPSYSLRVTTMSESLDWTPAERKMHQAQLVAALPKHSGLTVVIRRFFGISGSR